MNEIGNCVEEVSLRNSAEKRLLRKWWAGCEDAGAVHHHSIRRQDKNKIPAPKLHKTKTKSCDATLNSFKLFNVRNRKKQTDIFVKSDWNAYDGQLHLHPIKRRRNCAISWRGFSSDAKHFDVISRSGAKKSFNATFGRLNGMRRALCMATEYFTKAH